MASHCFHLLAALVLSIAQPPTARIAGTIVSPAGDPLAGVAVTLAGDRGVSRIHVTGDSGAFDFGELPAGMYHLEATLTGYEDRVVEDLVVKSGEHARVELTLSLERFSESVRIEAAVEEDPTDPEEAVELRIEELDLLPLASDRFHEALPLLPGVVRDPEGRLSFNGARPSQSLLLVNGANVTDPLTGEFAVELPLKAIETLEVNTLPYSAEYGQANTAVAEITTRGGTDTWDFDANNLLPKPNFRGGKIKGFKSAVPQFQMSGPLKKGALWISQGLTFRYVRSRVFDIEAGEDERVLEGFDTFTQLDFRLGGHHLTTTFSYFPQEIDNLGINAVTPAEATPDFDAWGWNAAVSDRVSYSRTLVETVLAMKTYDVAIRPKSDRVAVLGPDGLRNNYFNELNRESTRTELRSTITHAPPDLFGEHLVKIGGTIAHVSFSGSDAGLPIEIRSAEDRLIRRIEFAGDPGIGGSDLQVSGFVQDQWRLNDRLGLDVGLRYDYDRLVQEHQLAPRLSGALALDNAARTVLKAGFGVFYDHVFLHSDSFDRYQSRIETDYDAEGRPAGPPVVFRPRVSDRDLEMARGVAWNVELNRQLRKGLDLRINYRERRGSKEMVVDRVEEDGAGAMLLSSRGESRARELDLTLRLSPSEEQELLVSYVRMRSEGDLNNFGTLYQNLRSPLLLERESSTFELDVPNRFLLWGIWRLGGDIIISPGVELRSGFPYTAFREDYTVAGERNRGGRFPMFLSADIRVTKGITVLGRRARIGVQVFNLGGHDNPRDVIRNESSSRFGEFLNSPGMSLSLRFRLLF